MRIPLLGGSRGGLKDQQLLNKSRCDKCCSGFFVLKLTTCGFVWDPSFVGMTACGVVVLKAGG